MVLGGHLDFSMVTVFLSYSSADKPLASRIAGDLDRSGFKVWFDEWEIQVGHSISQNVDRGLQEADFVAVLLTSHSVNSGWVQKEWQSKIGEEAVNKKVSVLPLRGEACEIPPLLRDKKYADFVEDYRTGIDALTKAIWAHSGNIPIEQISENPVTPERSTELAIGGLPFPCFFPSISGAAKNSLSPLDHLKIMIALRHPLFLVSAFDIAMAKNRKDRLDMQRLIEKATSHGQILVLDSGLYEKKWLRAKSWPKVKFHETLRNTSCHLAFCYDDPNPKGTIDNIVSDIVRAVVIDQRKGDMDSISPVVHAKDPADFPEMCTQLAKRTNPPLIAVPERELGEGILAVAEKVRLIRQALNATGQYYPLHILGAGNPLSILIYVACGADSFDGLDWCQTVVDHSTGRLYHSLQLDFFAQQTQYGSELRLPYLSRLFAHNLDFYSNWTGRIRAHLGEGTIMAMIDEFVPSQSATRLSALVFD